MHISLDTLEDKPVRNANLINIDTYAWSAENVLYNIFGVRTVRNYYFEMDLRQLIDLVKDKSQNLQQIISLIDKLKQHTIDKNDPLNIILKEAERYLMNATNIR